MTMIVERALALAGPDAVIASRPRGVPHVYVGPLTPSGRLVPRAGRTVCRAYTRRLTVIPRSERRSSLDPCGPARVCARCSARLSSSPGDGRAESLTNRDEYAAKYAGTTKADVAFALQLASTADEVDAAAHLSLVLFGVAGCNGGFAEQDRTWPSLHDLVVAARSRVGGFDDTFSRAVAERHDERSAAAAEQRTRERREAWKERQERLFPGGGRLNILR